MTKVVPKRLDLGNPLSGMSFAVLSSVTVQTLLGLHVRARPLRLQGFPDSPGIPGPAFSCPGTHPEPLSTAVEARSRPLLVRTAVMGLRVSCGLWAPGGPGPGLSISGSPAQSLAQGAVRGG